MAVDRFETRRLLVLQDANAIATTYLRVQLLDEPHRARISKLLVDYTDNRIVLARAKRGENAKLLADNDRMLTDLWAATAAAFEPIADLDFSTSFIDTVNNVVELDAARKASRLAHVPTGVLVVLSIYIVVTAGVLGYVLTGFRGQVAGSFLITLLTVCLAMIVDLERPTVGSIAESQAPMELLRKSLENQPPEVFDRWRSARSEVSPEETRR
jgi:predicted neutral ceramidase superfamily lipid hydrolase